MKEQSFFKRWWQGSKIGRWFVVIGILLLAVGVVLLFTSPSSDKFVETTAEIVQIIEERSFDDEVTYYTFVEYRVDGVLYRQQLDTYDGTFYEGKQITVYFNPENPSEVHGSTTSFTLYAFIAGGVCLLIGIAGMVIVFTQAQKADASQSIAGSSAPQYSISPDRTLSDTETTYYYQYNRKPVMQGYFLEDKNRKKLIEAEMVKNSLLGQYEYKFKNYQNATERTHFVGHTTESSLGAADFEATLSSTFTFDGVDVWKYLQTLGVTVSLSGLSVGGVTHTVYYNGKEIASIKQTSVYVHEEDEEKHAVAKHVPAHGFYRITTRETDLSVLFLVTFALTRTNVSLSRM